MAMADIAIAGGGPAGAFAAYLLRRGGANVILVDGNIGLPRIEGLSPRVLAILTRHGVNPRGLGPPVNRQVVWGGLAPVTNVEHAVDRHVFDQSLRDAAAGLGVRIIQGETIRSTAPGRIRLAAGEVRARLVLEARGRRAAVQAGALRGPETIALAGLTGCADAPAAHVQAEPWGWRWEAALPGAGTWTQITLDAEEIDPGRIGLADTWHRLTGDQPPANVRSRAAEIRLTAPELDPALPRLGDAAIAMDPLSGHGIFWALSSALAAPPLVAAIMAGETDLASAFYRDRVVETFWRQARIGRDFHRLAGLHTPFWARRAAWPDNAPAHPEVAEPQLQRRVIVRDGRLVDAEVLITAHDPGGAAFVYGVELAPILRRLDDQRLPDRETFCSHIVPDIARETAIDLYNWLTDRGVRTQPRTR